jgi:hypothetical protein
MNVSSPAVTLRSGSAIRIVTKSQPIATIYIGGREAREATATF